MPPRFTEQELGLIQSFQMEEGIWMDMVIRSMNPRWLIWLAERKGGGGFAARAAAFLASWHAGLEKRNNRHTEFVKAKGFRKPQERLNAISTTLYKHVRACKEVRDESGNRTRPTCSAKCVVASHMFDVGLQLR